MSNPTGSPAGSTAAATAFPRSPPPDRRYVSRTRKRGLGPNVDAQMVTRYEVLREYMAQLSAIGVIDEHLYEDRDSLAVHAVMAARHLRRACALALASLLQFVSGSPPSEPRDQQQAIPASSSRRGPVVGGSPRRGPVNSAASGASALPDQSLDDGPDESGLEGSPTPASLARRGLIMPIGTWKEKWDLLILFLIVYSAVVVPIRVCFDYGATGFMWKLEVSMTLAFIVDVVLSFNTVTFHAQTGKWITSRDRIAKAYLTSWFWIDAPSSVPVELITLFFDAQGLGLLRVLRMVRLIRLVKLLKIEEYIETLENAFDTDLRALRLVLMVTNMVFLMHIMGCFWFGLSTLGAEGTDESWRHSYADGEAAEPDAGVSLEYRYSLYWSATTMTTVGYGDLIPGNDVERRYAIFAMLVAAIIFGYMLSQIGVLVASLDRQAAIVEEKTDIVKEYVEWRSLPRDLALRIKKHTQFAYAKSTGFNEVELLEGLSPSLRAEVTRFVLKETLGKLPLFSKTLDPEFQIEIFPYIKPVSYSASEVIFRKGEPSRELMFLLAGEVTILSPLDNRPSAVISKNAEVLLGPNGDPVLTLQNAGVFGESVVLGHRRQATHVATTPCETLVLEKADIETLFAKSQRTAQHIVAFLHRSASRRQRLQSMVKKFTISCLPRGDRERAALILQMHWHRVKPRFLGPEGTTPLSELVAAKAAAAEADTRKRVADVTERAVLETLRGMRERLQQPH